MTRRRKLMERASNIALLAVGAVVVWSIFSPDPVPQTPPPVEQAASEPPPQDQAEADPPQDMPDQPLAIALPPPPPPAVQAPAIQTPTVQPETPPPASQPVSAPPPQAAPQPPAPQPVVQPAPQPPTRTITALQPSTPAPVPEIPVTALRATPEPVAPAPVTVAALTPSPVAEPPPPVAIAALQPSPEPVETPPLEFPEPITVEPIQPLEVMPVEVEPVEVMPDPVSDPVEVANPSQESESEPSRQEAPPPPPQQSAAPPPPAPTPVPEPVPAPEPVATEVVQVAVNTPEGAQTERQGRALLRLMEMDAGPDLRIAWPAAAGERERLYRVLSACYGMKSVLMDGQGGIFLAEGPAGQSTAPDVARYSGFVRAAEGAIPALERTALRPIYRHHGLSERAAQIVRLFPRRADALVLGGLAQLLDGGLAKGSQVEALYTLTAQGLAIVEIRQNGRPVDGRVVIAPVLNCGGLV